MNPIQPGHSTTASNQRRQFSLRSLLIAALLLGTATGLLGPPLVEFMLDFVTSYQQQPAQPQYRTHGGVI